MKVIQRYTLFIILLFSSILISCSRGNDESRGFMSTATVVGNAVDGYYCYLDGGGLVISHSHELDGVERGYLAFQYSEGDWVTSSEKGTYIQNAIVYPYSIYNVVRPININDEKSKPIIESAYNVKPPLFTVGNGYRGYFGMNTGLSIVNILNGDKVPASINAIYDPARQTPDSLFLRLYYSMKKPVDWTNTGFEYGALSCDISSLKNLQQWKDSVVVTVDVADGLKHTIKISRNDFLKPNIISK